jgi:DNA polymerase-3 subunit delta
MAQWIMERTASLGGSISSEAALALAGLTGDNTRLADMEITKLLDYVNYDRPVEPEDVHELTPDAAQVYDFALVNALRQLDTRKAQAVLHKKLEQEDPMPILGSMIYQFRLLLLARDIIDLDNDQQDVINQFAQFKVPYFPAKLAHDNAVRFSPEALRDIYHQLLEIDDAIKSGKMTADLALDLFIVQFTN